MQFVIDSLDSQWSLPYQFSIISRWMKNSGIDVQMITTNYSATTYPELTNNVTETSNPSDMIDPTRPTLSGPYPATAWVHSADVDNYAVCLSHLPWHLYPNKKQEWIGQLDLYSDNNWKLFTQSMKQIFKYPWAKLRRWWLRRVDYESVDRANYIFTYDKRLKEPISDVYNQNATMAVPSAPIGRGKTTEPDKKFMYFGPFDPPQNIKLVIDGFYLFINRLGTRKNRDWESNQPLRMWQSGDFELHLHGGGKNVNYLRNYADSQGLEDQVKFFQWPQTGELEEFIQSSLGVIDIPLTGTASAFSYHAIALGVPAIHSYHHEGLDSLLDQNSLAIKVGCNNDNEIAKSFLEASKIPKSKRKRNSVLKKALDPESVVKFYREKLTS